MWLSHDYEKDCGKEWVKERQGKIHYHSTMHRMPPLDAVKHGFPFFLNQIVIILSTFY